MHTLALMLMVCGVFFQRPMIFGYYEASIGLWLLAVSIVFAYLHYPNSKLVVRDGPKVFYYSIGVSLAYALVIFFIAGASIAFKYVLISMVSLFSLFYVIQTNPLASICFVRNVLRLIVASTLITLAVSGFNVDNLIDLSVFSFPIKDRSELLEADIYFPFSTIPFRMTPNEFVVLPRATYLSIEPGVGVMVVMLWRYLEWGLKGYKSVIADIIFLGALFATASTSAPIMFFAWFVLRQFFVDVPIINIEGGIKIYSKIRFLWGVIFTLISIYLVFYLPFFGFFDKSMTHGSSFDDRIDLLTGESYLLRFVGILLLGVYYVAIRKLVDSSFIVLYFSLCTISVLNVMAFSPFFFLPVFLSMCCVPYTEEISVDRNYLRIRS